MKSLRDNVVYPDWSYITMLNGNIKWMKNRPNPEDYLISTRKENALLQDYITNL